jgi:hypothetical protein
MAEVDDILGDLLREFYGTFGIPEEGPPRGLDVTAMLGSNAVAESEISILRAALGDSVAHRQFQTCRALIEDLATRLTGEELLHELSGIPVPQNGLEQLSSGVFWFALASSLDFRQEGLPVTPFDEIIGLPLPLKIQMTVHGSLVFRLYIALVYMREGVLSDLIRQSSKAGGRCSAVVSKLMNSDYVRRVRNALSHGSFSAGMAGLVFRDDHGVIAATPGFLNWLCTWLALIQLQGLAASARNPHIA